MWSRVFCGREKYANHVNLPHPIQNSTVNIQNKFQNMCNKHVVGESVLRLCIYECMYCFPQLRVVLCVARGAKAKSNYNSHRT